MKYKDIKIYPHHFWFVLWPSEAIIIKHGLSVKTNA